MDHFCIRYGTLNTDEQAPYAKICKVIQGYGSQQNESASFYIQVSKDEEKPRWISMGEFLEKVFRDKFKDKAFSRRCLKLFEKTVS